MGRRRNLHRSRNRTRLLLWNRRLGHGRIRLCQTSGRNTAGRPYYGPARYISGAWCRLILHLVHRQLRLTIVY